ncbi:MAG: TIGR04282 family arsenosugar biosynthesis glycosyltransferase [Euryarchaeota archaeon]|nr:TIGR04282 family arsenosugar biosynthesis glycosyltransferase [Euryarchaeota archaeon]
MTKDQDTCILLFVKYPEKGKVKLRLSRNLNEDIVLELYRFFVLDTLTAIKKIDVPFFICFHPPDVQSKFQSWLGSTLLFLPQRGSDLGERMKNSLTEVFSKGFRKAILMGSDSPDLPEDYIKQAFTILETKDVVLGPTVDGGYYLIGFRTTTFTPGVFDKIHWSTPQVFQETMMKIKQAHRSVGLLPVWSDIDTLSDLHNLIRRTSNTSFKSSNTLTYIRQHPIQVENDHEKKSDTE